MGTLGVPQIGSPDQPSVSLYAPSEWKEWNSIVGPTHGIFEPCTQDVLRFHPNRCWWHYKIDYMIKNAININIRIPILCNNHVFNNVAQSHAGTDSYKGKI